MSRFLHMLRMALRSLRRSWRSGELAVLLVSLTIAVAALTGVGFLVDRIGRAVQAQASEVLAADARVESPEPLAPELNSYATQQGLHTARLTTLLSVVFNGDVSQLADVRAASAGYPLRGALRVAAQPFGSGMVTLEIPPSGECWPDSRLAAALGVGVGGTINVGARGLRVSQIVISRPDQGSAFVEFAPALLINDLDLAATKLVQPASRMQYALLLAGRPGDLSAYGTWFGSHARPGERLAAVSDASPQIGDAARRASRFLSLASLVAVLLCAVAVAMSARAFLARHLDAVALLKTLGASRRFVLGVHVLQLLMLAVAATLIGSLVGWFTELNNQFGPCVLFGAVPFVIIPQSDAIFVAGRASASRLSRSCSVNFHRKTSIRRILPCAGGIRSDIRSRDCPAGPAGCGYRRDRGH